MQRGAEPPLQNAAMRRFEANVRDARASKALGGTWLSAWRYTELPGTFSDDVPEFDGRRDYVPEGYESTRLPPKWWRSGEYYNQGQISSRRVRRKVEGRADWIAERRGQKFVDFTEFDTVRPRM